MPTQLDTRRCLACGDCVFHCGAWVYEQDLDGVVRVARPAACTHCLLCVERCPAGALRVVFAGGRAGGRARQTPQAVQPQRPGDKGTVCPDEEKAR